MPGYRVVSSWKRIYDTPILAVAGDRVKLGRHDDDAPGWIWCDHMASSLSGWVPEHLLNRDEEQLAAVIRQDYSAMELTVLEGQAVSVLESVAGWSWCVADSGDAGWVPTRNLAAIG